MGINELAEKLGGEVVGGRLVATVNGKRVYLTNVGAGGEQILNEVGLEVSNSMSFEEPPAKKTRRKAEAPAVDLAQIEPDL